MNFVPRSVFCGVLALVGMLGVFGCSDGVGKRLPVAGKVLVNGKPLPGGAQVHFAPVKAQSGTRWEIHGKVDASGAFKMETNGIDGVPAGEYTVTLTTDAAAISDPTKVTEDKKKKDPTAAAVRPFDAKYESTATSGLKITVPSDNYDLKIN